MSYPPELLPVDMHVLAIIGRGHPNRNMTATTKGRSIQVPALTWDEIQIAADLPHTDLANAIAHLVANDLINSGRQTKGLFGRIFGGSTTHHFWINDLGRVRLENPRISPLTQEVENEDSSISENTLPEVEKFLIDLGYDLTPYGAAVALAEVVSGYSCLETASHLALTTLALDAQEAGLDIQIHLKLATHGRAIIDVLNRLRASNPMREMQFKNDVRAIMGVSIVDKGQRNWIEKVLSDPISGKERLAHSRINWDNIS